MRQQFCTVAVAFEKRSVEPILECANLVAHGRLCDAKFVRRPAEAAVAGDGFEDPKSVEWRLRQDVSPLIFFIHRCEIVF